MLPVPYQRLLFALILFYCSVFLLERMTKLYPLYADAGLRAKVTESITAVTDREGWLLSDVDLWQVSPDSVSLTYRAHIRGPDPEQCYVLSLSTRTLSPCVID